MAANVTSAYAIGVTITSDASGFATGIQQAETAMAGLATTTQTAADTIDTSLAQDIPASADQSAIGLTTKASKFKAVGTQLGTNLAQGIAGGASGPEAALQTGGAVSNLLAATATTAKGAAALVGVGIGVAFISNIVKAVQARHQEVVDSFNSLFAEVKVSAGDTALDIRNILLNALTAEDAFKELGGGDVNAGFESLNRLAEGNRDTLAEMAQIINADINPGNRDTFALLHDIARETETVTLGHGLVTEQLTQEAIEAQKVLDLAKENRNEAQATVDAKRGEVAYEDKSLFLLKETALTTDQLNQKYSIMGAEVGNAAAAAGRFVGHLSEAEQIAIRIGSAIGNAAAALDRALSDTQ